MATPEAKAPRVLVRASERGPDFPTGHPYNPRCEIHGWLLSRPAGLARIAVNLAWLPPGKESSIRHLHYREEEWAYVVAGRGVAEIGDGEHEIGPGDFLGFPPGVAHHLRNTGGEELLFLEGGEIVSDVEVADFPTLRRRLVRYGAKLAVYPLDAEVPFLPPEADEAVEALLGRQRTVDASRCLVRADARPAPERWSHDENPRSEVWETPLAEPSGLARVAVNVARIPPGRDSGIFHLHHVQEEWAFVLAGRAVAEIGDAEHEVGPGDFLGFPAGGPAHHLRNVSGEDLVYVVGGDVSGGVEVVDFPRIGKRRVRLAPDRVVTCPLG